MQRQFYPIFYKKQQSKCPAKYAANLETYESACTIEMIGVAICLSLFG